MAITKEQEIDVMETIQAIEEERTYESFCCGTDYVICFTVKMSDGSKIGGENLVIDGCDNLFNIHSIDTDFLTAIYEQYPDGEEIYYSTFCQCCLKHQ